ncbi:MAG TPA: hypothetical protein VGV85_04055 [Longimicrobiaceae bacterium]|nr:hypothetical protein [Longimicrobiaceae bacterium]
MLMRVLTVLALPACLAPGAGAQQPAAPPGGYTVEVQLHDRWLHGRQRPEFTRFDTLRRWVHVDSAGAGEHEGGRVLFLTLGRPGPGDRARVVHDRSGRTTRMQVALPAPPPMPFAEPREESLRRARWRLFDGEYGRTRLLLPEARVWELVPTFHPARRERGARWTDTLRLAAEAGAFRQALDGVRVSRLLGDTLVAGRRLWIVGDSAHVRYEERWEHEERTLGGLAAVTRVLEGVVRGRHLYDPALRLFTLRHDTSALRGEAVLRYPDGRAFRTPVRYERFRRWDLHGPAAYRARVAVLEAARRAERDGMLVFPRGGLEQRVATGEPLVVDSVLSVLRRSRDPGERSRLVRALESWGPGGPELRERLVGAMLASGDTAGAVVAITSRLAHPSRPVRPETVRLLLPFMADPGRAFAFGLDRDPPYENFRQALLTCPPAITPDRGRWPCTPEACALLAAQWETATEPRLRDLGLVTRVSLEPARWADTVMHRRAAASVFLEPADQLVRGVGATWPAASQAPLPGAGADWRAWAEWMNGRNPAYGPAAAGPSGGPVRFEASHATALRFREAVTGRDVGRELRRQVETAATDSARLVFGSILLGLGEYGSGPEGVAERFRSGSAAERALAARELPLLFRSAQPVDSATASVLLDRLLGIVIAGEQPWPVLPGVVRRGSYGIGHYAKGQQPVLVLEDRLPAGVRERWRTRVQVVSAEELRSRPDRLPAIIFSASGVVRAGPFVRLGIDYSTRAARGEDQSPAGYAGGTMVYLLEAEDGWLIVAEEAWVT